MSTAILASRRDRSRVAGEAARNAVPAASLAGWKPAPDRPDPVALLMEQAETRLPNLVPVRHGRMAVSPFTYYRGAALPMAADLAAAPRTGIKSQLCGDAHLSNFGLFASPERDQVFDINDFDETLRGPFEWDLERLAASLVVAGRTRGFDAHATAHAVHRTAEAYRTRMSQYATMRAIDVYYARVDASAVLTAVAKGERRFLRQTVDSAKRHDALHELPKITAPDPVGGRRIVDHPPIVTHPPEVTPELVGEAMAGYRDSLRPDLQTLLDRYELADVALKVVGVGSVGLPAFAVLMFGAASDDPLFLQVKAAEASVLERFVAPSDAPSHGARVVAGQRALQAVSDILLGWTLIAQRRHWYVRQLQDQKGAADVEAMTPEDLATWGELCGWSLARGHARSGDPAEIAGYLGADKAWGHALAEFAAAYADQNERDYEAFVAAIKKGRISAEREA